MTDISQRTWKYLHGPDDVTHLSFKTDGVPRSFSAIQYSATERDTLDLNDNGIAVIDNDRMSVVLDGHAKDCLIEQADFMSKIRKMDWSYFAHFAVNHPRYRGNQADFDKDKPSPGVLINQIQRGVMHAPLDENDLRSPSMAEANASSDCPYSFPKTTRSDALDAILAHDCLRGEDGRWRLSWTLPSRSEHPYFQESDRADVMPEEAELWQKHCQMNPEIFDLATQSITEKYFSSAATTWPTTDAGRYAFCSGGIGHPNVICLETIDGAEIDFANRGEFGALLDALPDAAIRDIWKLLRVTDQDLESTKFITMVSEKLEPMRLEEMAAVEHDLQAQASLS